MAPPVIMTSTYGPKSPRLHPQPNEGVVYPPETSPLPFNNNGLFSLKFNERKRKISMKAGYSPAYSLNSHTIKCSGLRKLQFPMGNISELCEKQNFTASAAPGSAATLSEERNSHRSHYPVYPSALPYYETDQPQEIWKFEGEFNTTPTAEMKQQVTVFKQPDAPYYLSQETEDRNRSHSSGGSNAQTTMTEFSSPNSSHGEERGTPGSSRVFVYSYEEMNLFTSTRNSPVTEGELGAERAILPANDVHHDGNAEAPPQRNAEDSFPETLLSQQENPCDGSS